MNCMPMNGLNHKTDARKLYQLIYGFMRGETAETRINTKERKKDGRLDYLALLAHYGGKDNKEVWIKDAEALWTSLIYKN